MCIASCLPSGSSTSTPASDFERDEHADLAEARGRRVVDVGDDGALRRPRAALARRSDWFSPIVAMLSVSTSSTVPPGGHRRGLERVDIVALFERDRGDVADEVLELLVLGDEIGLAN